MAPNSARVRRHGIASRCRPARGGPGCRSGTPSVTQTSSWGGLPAAGGARVGHPLFLQPPPQGTARDVITAADLCLGRARPQGAKGLLASDIPPGRDVELLPPAPSIIRSYRLRARSRAVWLDSPAKAATASASACRRSKSWLSGRLLIGSVAQAGGEADRGEGVRAWRLVAGLLTRAEQVPGGRSTSSSMRSQSFSRSA
jgi:hypothetical protein